MDRCARLGPHKASFTPSRRTISAVFVLPQVTAVSSEICVPHGIPSAVNRWEVFDMFWEAFEMFGGASICWARYALGGGVRWIRSLEEWGRAAEGKGFGTDGEGRGGKWRRWQGYLGKVSTIKVDVPRPAALPSPSPPRTEAGPEGSASYVRKPSSTPSGSR